MPRQTLEPRKNEPIVIETPMGLIRITRSDLHRRKIQIETPEGVTAYVGEARAMEHARFCRQADDGRLVPTYTVLVPETADDGSLLGAQPQRPLRLTEASAPLGPIRLAQA